MKKKEQFWIQNVRKQSKLPALEQAQTADFVRKKIAL